MPCKAIIDSWINCFVGKGCPFFFIPMDHQDNLSDNRDSEEKKSIQREEEKIIVFSFLYSIDVRYILKFNWLI